MDAQIQNQGGKELSQRINASLKEPQPYELHDPLSDLTYRFGTAESAASKADEIGASRFQHRQSDGSVSQIDKVDGQWWVRSAELPPQHSQQQPSEEDKPLSALQAKLDLENLRAIQTRADERARLNQGFDADKEMALADSMAFRRIQNPAWQEVAAIEIANNARESTEYKISLDMASRVTAEKIYELDLANTGRDAAMKAENVQANEEAAKAGNLPSDESIREPEYERADEDQSRNADAAMKAENVQANEEAAQAGNLPSDESIREPEYERADEDQSRNTDAAMKAENVQANEEAAQAGNLPSDESIREPEYEELHINPADLDRIAAARERDSALARETLGFNTVEPNTEKESQLLPEDQDLQRAAWLNKGQQADRPKTPDEKKQAGNHVESDEIFTATQADIKPVVPPEIEKQYLRVGDKFYHSKNTDLVAFEDKGNKLETKSNSEAIAESMVRIAEARGWDEIKVSGSETFRKEVWLEAASRGMQIKGYTPSEQDKTELSKRLSQTEANKVEKDSKPFRARENEGSKKAAESPNLEKKTDTPNKRMAESFAKEPAAEAVKKYPELAGAAAAVAAMEKKAEADGLNEQQRAVVMARARQNVVNSIERGELPEVKVKETQEVSRQAEEKEYSR